MSGHPEIFLRAFFSIWLLLANFDVGAAQRVALVIGNSDYQYDASWARQEAERLGLATIPNSHWDDLQGNPYRDAADLAALLRSPPLSFEVIEARDLDGDSFLGALQDLERRLDEDTEIALFFYAGHGAQAEFRGDTGDKTDALLIPVDGKSYPEAALQRSGIRLSEVMGHIRKAEVKILLLDACRNQPGVRGKRGLPAVEASAGGYLIQYATAAGSVADNGLSDGNGLYTAALLRHLGRTDLSLGDIFATVAGEVQRNSSNRQLPFLSSTVGRVLRWHQHGKGPHLPTQSKVQGLRKEKLAEGFYFFDHREPEPRGHGLTSTRGHGSIGQVAPSGLESSECEGDYPDDEKWGTPAWWCAEPEWSLIKILNRVDHASLEVDIALFYVKEHWGGSAPRGTTVALVNMDSGLNAFTVAGGWFEVESVFVAPNGHVSFNSCIGHQYHCADVVFRVVNDAFDPRVEVMQGMKRDR